MMPFGLHFTSMIVGILAAWFLIPWIQGMWFRSRTPATPTV